MKKISLLTLGAALIAVPVLAAPGSGSRGDADGNGTLTRAEAQAHAAERFARMDVNKDGKIDASDRAARRAAMQTKMFERLDANKDGSISKAEWDQHSVDRAAKRGEKRADAGATEGKRGMRGHHGMRGGRHGMRGGMMMGKADTNGDKAISQAEFAQKQGQWLPNEEERSYVRSLMKQVTEPGKMANWIAPPIKRPTS